MNNVINTRVAALAVAIALVWAAAPAHAGNACEMVDADLGTEFTGDSNASGDSALACGIFNNAFSDLSTAIGNNNKAGGIAATAFGSSNTASGDQSVAIGAGNNAAGPASIAIGVGNQATGDVSIAIGDTSIASGAGSIAMGANANATADNSVALGSGSEAGRANTVSVGTAGRERQITNVAAGTQATDAVNLAQMRAGDAESKAYTDARIGGLDERLDRAGALSAAMVGMAASAGAVESGATRVGIAAGTYGGKSAVSIGVQRRFGARVAMTLGGAFSGSERSGTVGVGFGF